MISGSLHIFSGRNQTEFVQQVVVRDSKSYSLATSKVVNLLTFAVRVLTRRKFRNHRAGHGVPICVAQLGLTGDVLARVPPAANHDFVEHKPWVRATTHAIEL